MAEEAATVTAPVSVMAQFNAIAESLGGLDDGPTEEALTEAPEAEEATEAATPAEAAPEGEKQAEPKPKKSELSPAQHAAIREERRQALAKVERREAEAERRIQEVARYEAGLAAKLQAAEATSPANLRKLVESGAYDDVAKLLGAKDWTDLNSQIAVAISDPSYKRVRELEAREQQREAAEKQRAEEFQAEQQRRVAVAREQQFQEAVGAELAAAEDPIVKGFVTEEPDMFVGAVTNCMKDVYRNGLKENGRVVYRPGTELDVHEAAALIVAKAKARAARWQKIFGGQPTDEQAETAQAGTPDRAGRREQHAKPTKHVTRTRAASSATSSGELSEAEWQKMAKAEMLKAELEEARAGRT